MTPEEFAKLSQDRKEEEVNKMKKQLPKIDKVLKEAIDAAKDINFSNLTSKIATRLKMLHILNDYEQMAVLAPTDADKAKALAQKIKAYSEQEPKIPMPVLIAQEVAGLLGEAPPAAAAAPAPGLPPAVPRTGEAEGGMREKELTEMTDKEIKELFEDTFMLAAEPEGKINVYSLWFKRGSKYFIEEASDSIWATVSHFEKSIPHIKDMADSDKKKLWEKIGKSINDHIESGRKKFKEMKDKKLIEEKFADELISGFDELEKLVKEMIEPKLKD